MTRARVIGTGSYLPERVLTNKEMESLCDTTDEWIRQRTGIEQRYVAAEDEATSDLMTRASERAIADAGLTANDIDLVIACTLTPDYLFPATGCVVQGNLGAERAAAFDVNAACSGFLYGLASANALIQTGLYKTIVLTGGEVVSNKIIYKHRDTGVLFGDGAGALVLQAQEGDHGVLSMHLGSDGANGDMLILPIGGSRQPTTSENADYAFTIHMKGQELFKNAVVAMGDASRKVLGEVGLTVEDVDLFVPHQANARIIEASAQRMGLSQDKVMININHAGNTTHGTLPIALDEAKRGGRLKEGDCVVLATFGAGVTWGASVVRW